MIRLRGVPPSCSAQCPKAQYLATQMADGMPHECARLQKLKQGPGSRSFCHPNQVSSEEGIHLQLCFAFGFHESQAPEILGISATVHGSKMDAHSLPFHL